ncbi:MAG TPA: energy transducer TonB [candidate division Zixibacteria bacterium]|nr:energy transducer TonB [candidate division Zixibacteria bacterium]
MPFAAQTVPIPNRVRAPEDVLARHLVHRVEPVLAPEESHAEGTVVLAIVVGKDGKVIQVRGIEGDPKLVQSAIKAVREWRYEPYLLNGTPVEIQSQVTLRFRGQHKKKQS